jgi:isopenicillin-N epimerase
MSYALKSQFLLDRDVVYLNHGSFGACPAPVFADYQHWQRELEREPVDFFSRRSRPLMAASRAALGALLNVSGDDLVYFANPTTACNMVARSLQLGPGDEVLSTDHAYGAMERTFQFLAKSFGFTYRRQPMPLPFTTAAAFVERFWQGVTPATKVIFIDHISSASAVIFPVAEICRRARAAGILTLIDGAHAPSQLKLDLRAIDADLYIGACHKWLCAPKGSAFLYARRAMHPQLMPLVVSWGYLPDTEPGERQLRDYHEWQGTRDMAPFIATAAAIRFQQEHDWDTVRADCHALLKSIRARVQALTEMPPLYPEAEADSWYSQMATLPLPAETDPAALRQQLWGEYKIEAPIHNWGGHNVIRISIQGYNTEADADALLAGLKAALGR